MESTLIIKYLQKKCTPEEAEKVVEWMHSKHFEPDLLKLIEKDLNTSLSSEVTKDESLQSMLQSILLRDQMDQVESGKHMYIVPIKNSHSYPWYLKVAATLLILFSVSFLLFKYSDKTVPNHAQKLSELVVKENSAGRKSTIFLPDGSIVNLNSESEIRYQEDFSDSSRVVYLSGEAFFEVAKDAARPFVVYTDNISVTALGTSFNVHSYQNEDKLFVSLATGKVVVQQKDQSEKVFLNPGQEVEYVKKNRQFSDPQEYSDKSVYGWVKGLIYFQSAGLDEVTSKLERWYGVEFKLMNESPTTWSYTGEFNNQSLKSVLESLSFSLNFTYLIDDKKVLINFNEN